MNDANQRPEHVGEIGQRITLTGTVRTATRVNGFTPRSPDRALMVRHLLAGARRDADRLPVEETLRDILCIAAAAAGEPAVRPAA